MSIIQFCVRKSSSATPAKVSSNGGQLFKPFILKTGMKLAPVHRSTPLTKNEMENFDCTIDRNDEDFKKVQLYLEQLREGLHKPHSSKRTVVTESVEALPVADVECNARRGPVLRKKLLQFHEDRRPSKYGFWFKTTKKISGRKPFKKDVNVFDYEVDSDEEWEDVEGDDCKSDEEDEEAENEKDAGDDEDKEFFVDHGYLSTSENASDEEDGDPESKRERGKAKLITFEAQMESRKKKQLRLIQFGPIWSNNGQFDNVYWSQKRTEFKAVLLSNSKPILTNFTPEVRKMTPLRSFRKTPGSDRKSVKRKTQNAGTKQSKRAALSLP